MIAVGVGASRGCPVGELEDLVATALAEAGVVEHVDVLASADVKADEAAILALAAARGVARSSTFPARGAGGGAAAPDAVERRSPRTSGRRASRERPAALLEPGARAATAAS